MSNLAHGHDSMSSSSGAQSPVTGRPAGGRVLPRSGFSLARIEWNTMPQEIRAILPQQDPIAFDLDRKVFAGSRGRYERLTGWAAWGEGAIWQGTVQIPLAPTEDGRWRRAGPPAGNGRTWTGARLYRRTVQAPVAAEASGARARQPDHVTTLDVLPVELAKLFPAGTEGSISRAIGPKSIREVVDILAPSGEGVLVLRAQRWATRESALAKAHWQALMLSARGPAKAWHVEVTERKEVRGSGLQWLLGRPSTPPGIRR